MDRRYGKNYYQYQPKHLYTDAEQEGYSSTKETSLATETEAWAHIAVGATGACLSKKGGGTTILP